jgi:hypothetical protein
VRARGGGGGGGGGFGEVGFGAFYRYHFISQSLPVSSAQIFTISWILRQPPDYTMVLKKE